MGQKSTDMARCIGNIMKVKNNFISENIYLCLKQDILYRVADISEVLNIQDSSIRYALNSLVRGGLMDRVKVDGKCFYKTRQYDLF